MASECGFCEKPILEGQQWVLVNRIVVGSGINDVYTEHTDEDGVYEWGPEGGVTTGTAYHRGECLSGYLDKCCARADITMMMREEGLDE